MISIDIVYILASLGYSQEQIRDLICSILSEPDDTLFLPETPTSSYPQMVRESFPPEQEQTYKPDIPSSKVTQCNTSNT